MEDIHKMFYDFRMRETGKWKRFQLKLDDTAWKQFQLKLGNIESGIDYEKFTLFEKLPEEMRLYILTFLRIEDLGNFIQCDKMCHRIGTEPKLWKNAVITKNFLYHKSFEELKNFLENERKCQLINCINRAGGICEESTKQVGRNCKIPDDRIILLTGDGRDAFFPCQNVRVRLSYGSRLAWLLPPSALSCPDENMVMHNCVLFKIPTYTHLCILLFSSGNWSCCRQTTKQCESYYNHLVILPHWTRVS